MKPGDQFKIIETDTQIVLSRVQEREGKEKLPKPILHFDYVGGGRKGFTTYENEVNSMLNRERWERV